MTNPSREMGTFLRTWRSEWAGLSRAQLALAVSGGCGDRKGVTEAIVREWEDGQPPKSSAELQALCTVMRRHGLTDPEVQQFRQVVFAACADRQYPEFFGAEDLIDRPDVDAIGEAAYRQCDRTNRPPMVHLIAAAAELRQAVTGTAATGGSRSQARKRQVALGYLLGALPRYLDDRRQWEARAASACADFLEAHFGPSGLGGQLTVLALRGLQAHAAAHDRTRPGDQVAWARRALALHEEAVATDRPGDAAVLFRYVMDALGELEPGAYVALLPVATSYCHSSYEPPPAGHMEAALAWSALAEGLTDAAERHWADLRNYEPDNPIETCRIRGWIALQRTDYNEAERQFEACARAEGGHPRALALPQYLELCAWARKKRERISFREYRLGRRWV